MQPRRLLCAAQTFTKNVVSSLLMLAQPTHSTFRSWRLIKRDMSHVIARDNDIGFKSAS